MTVIAAGVVWYITTVFVIYALVSYCNRESNNEKNLADSKKNNKNSKSKKKGKASWHNIILIRIMLY